MVPGTRARAYIRKGKVRHPRPKTASATLSTGARNTSGTRGTGRSSEELVLVRHDPRGVNTMECANARTNSGTPKVRAPRQATGHTPTPIVQKGAHAEDKLRAHPAHGDNTCPRPHFRRLLTNTEHTDYPKARSGSPPRPRNQGRKRAPKQAYRWGGVQFPFLLKVSMDAARQQEEASDKALYKK